MITFLGFDEWLVLFIWLLLCFWPGSIASRRRHPNTTAIRVCGIVGFFAPPLWIVAVIWAFKGGGQIQEVDAKSAYEHVEHQAIENSPPQN